MTATDTLRAVHATSAPPFRARFSTSTVGKGAQNVDLASLRVAGGVMLAAAAVRPLFPGEPGLPCPLRMTTGIPCPFCGMTTSVTAAAHLDLAAAAAANPAGILAVVVAIALLVVRRPASLRLPRWVIPAAIAGMWVFELHRFSIV